MKELRDLTDLTIHDCGMHLILFQLGEAFEPFDLRPGFGVSGFTSKKVDIRLPGKGNSNSHGARPVY